MPVGFIATYINLYIQKHIYTYTYLYLGIKLFQYKWLCVRLFGCLCVRVINGYPWKCHCRQVGNHVTPHRHCLRTRALTPTLPHHKGWYICMYVDWFVGSLVRRFVCLFGNFCCCFGCLHAHDFRRFHWPLSGLAAWQDMMA